MEKAEFLDISNFSHRIRDFSLNKLAKNSFFERKFGNTDEKETRIRNFGRRIAKVQYFIYDYL